METSYQYGKILSNWLFICAGFVAVMVVIGAITRLTDSGLSMVEWRPLIGTLPPLSDAEWMRVFQAYQASPEFVHKNGWMVLSDFKQIFFWEWFHRLWGRLIGVVFAVPFFVFMIRGWIPQGERLKLIGMLALGGAQGYMGWYMVQSGLADIPAVSHYRLAAHLGLALLIVSLLLWLGLRFRGVVQHPDRALYMHGWVVLGILCLTIFWGAYVAGLDAGLIYNSYPLMNGHVIPSEIFQLSPIWINFLEQPGGVQFVHRWLGMAVMIAVISFVVRAVRYRGHNGWYIWALGLMVVVQFALGLATLLSAVYLPLGVLHQLGAVILLLLMVANLYMFKPNITGL